MASICIALDAMGGDHGPRVVVPAAIKALSLYPNLQLIFVLALAAGLGIGYILNSSLRRGFAVCPEEALLNAVSKDPELGEP